MFLPLANVRLAFGLTYASDFPSRRGTASSAESPSLAIAALAAIARTTVVHRTILAALLASRLIRRKSDRANHGRENRK
jgi:hypothetical protein